LYIVRESSWNVNTKNVYSWGAALQGPQFDGVYAIGPGYDDSAVPDRDTPVRERRGGKYYRDSWKKLLALTDKTDNHLIAIETWNEYHEGTEIAPSTEHGKKYLNITKEYVNKFKSGFVPDNYPGERLMKAERASIDFSSGNIKGTGIKYIECADGKNKVVEEDSSYCLKPSETEFPGKYMYFQVDPLFKRTKSSSEYKLKIEYYDSVQSKFRVQFDSQNFSGPHNGAYKSTDIINPLGTLTWRVVTINLENVNLEGRQNCDADFRIHAIDEELCIKSIAIEPK
ncbi:glycoside hydrolase family 99-like domain-containing protein, partial [Candidatus Bipolaricaulota bacterium]|nr:glycoside hydrolase family 99-like domain-containing protein [Candidatus Bipolaricaulota bacterium]